MELIFNSDELTALVKKAIVESKADNEDNSTMETHYFDRDEQIKFYIENFIKREIPEINLEIFKRNKGVYDKALKILYDIIKEYKVSRNDFLKQIILKLSQLTRQNWLIKRDYKKYKTLEYVRGHCPSIYNIMERGYVPDDYPEYKCISGKKISIYFKSNDKKIIYSEKNIGEYTPENAINQDLFNYATIDGFNAEFDEPLRSIYKDVFFQFLATKKDEILKKFIVEYTKYAKMMEENKEKLIMMLRRINILVEKINSNIIKNKTTENDFELYDSLLYGPDYNKHMNMPESNYIKFLINRYNHEQLEEHSVDQSVYKLLKLDNNTDGELGWYVVARWKTFGIYDNAQMVFIKVSDDITILLNLYNKYLKNLKINYNPTNSDYKEFYHDRRDYNSEFDEGGFQGEEEFKLDLILNGKNVPFETYLAHLEEIEKIIKKVESLDLESPNSSDVIGLINFDDTEYDISDSEDEKKAFLKNGYVEGEETTWKKGLVLNLCNFIRGRMILIKQIINDYYDNQMRVKYLNDRAEFYDNFYRNYSKRLALLDKKRKMENLLRNTELKLDYSNMVIDIFNDICAPGGTSYEKDNYRKKAPVKKKIDN